MRGVSPGPRGIALRMQSTTVARARMQSSATDCKSQPAIRGLLLINRHYASNPLASRLVVISPVSNIYVWTATSGVSANRDQSAGAGNEQAALASRPPRLTTQLLPCVFLHGFRDLRFPRMEAEASPLQGRSLQCL